jgi:hypothetical protein
MISARVSIGMNLVIQMPDGGALSSATVFHPPRRASAHFRGRYITAGGPFQDRRRAQFGRSHVE